MNPDWWGGRGGAFGSLGNGTSESLVPVKVLGLP
jgi:hypothetical protein